jgi:hypothetical protein
MWPTAAARARRGLRRPRPSAADPHAARTPRRCATAARHVRRARRHRPVGAAVRGTLQPQGVSDERSCRLRAELDLLPALARAGRQAPRRGRRDVGDLRVLRVRGRRRAGTAQAGLPRHRRAARELGDVVSAPIERKLPAAKPPVRPAPYVEPEGLDLLEAMDAGAPLTAGPDEDEIELDEEAAAERLGPDGDASSSSPELEEEEAAAVGDLAVSSTAVTPSAGELERAAAPSTPTAKRAPRPRGYWTIDRIVEGFKKHFELTGAAPTTTVLNGSKGPVPEYLPAWTNLRKVSTYDEILTRAGLERPQRASTRGTRSRRLAAESTTTRSEREPQAGDGALGPAAPPKVETPASTEPQATAPSSRSDIAGWIKVAGTGLAYRNSMEAYVAADEIEADGERVAQACRDDGNEERADLAIDQARELAEKIRAAARAADESGTTAGTTEREPQEARERPADAEPTSELPATQAPPTPVAPSRSALEPREAPPRLDHRPDTADAAAREAAEGRPRAGRRRVQGRDRQAARRAADRRRRDRHAGSRLTCAP